MATIRATNQITRAIHCAAALGVVALGASAGQAQSDHQIPLNYNFHGMAHGSAEAFTGATGANADLILFRGISDRGLYWDASDPDAIGTQPLVGATGITYALFNPLGYANTTAPSASDNGLDIVHLGSRVYFRGMETSANPGTTTGQAVPWAPIMDVTTLSGSGTVATGITGLPHGLTVGQTIAIVGANPPAFSGEFVIASTPTPTSFTYACTATGTATGSMFCNSTSTPIISALSGSGSTVTATTVWPHGFAVGNEVNVTGASIASYLGQSILATANTPNTQTFTYASSATGTPTGNEIILATCIHDTVDQTTTLSDPVTVDPTTEIGVLFNSSDSGNQLAAFDTVLTFGSDPSAISVTARFSSPDWAGPQIDPPIISKFVSSERRVAHTSDATHLTFHAVAGNDSGNLTAFATLDASPSLNVVEGIISVQSIINAGFAVNGLPLTKITFRNAFFNPTQITALTFASGVGTATMATTNNPFVVGQPIVIAGVTPAAYNGTYKIASISGVGTTFTFLAPGAPDGAGAAQRYANTTPATNIALSGTVATVSTSSPHGLAVGDSVTVSGSSIVGANGTYGVTTVTSPTVFSYPCISTGAVAANMQVTRIGQNRGYAIYAATVRTSSMAVVCCNNTTGACTTALNICPGGATVGTDTSCMATSCPATTTCCNNGSGACSVIFGGSCPTGTTQTGTGNSCDPGSNPCPPSGACCTGVNSQACAQSLQVACAGIYSGDNTSCSPDNPCFPADECSGAIPITIGNPATGNTAGATASGTLMINNLGSCTQATFNTGMHLDVFYSFIAPVTTSYEIDTCGPAGLDTVLTINSGCPISQGNLLDCNDDSSNSMACSNSQFQSRIASVALLAGQTCYIGVGGYNGATGGYTLNVNYANPSDVGSCCVDGACTLAASAQCSGTFVSGGVCDPNPCSAPAGGVCCRGATCSTSTTVADQNSCAATLVAGQTAGAVFTSAATACNAMGTTNSPCCYADYNKVNGISVQDIFDFLGDWFAGSPFANVASSGDPGQLSVQNIFDFLGAWFAGGC